MSIVTSDLGKIKFIKEQIHSAIKNKGVDISSDTLFEEYPAEIGKISGGSGTDESEILTVKNNTGTALNAGDKVFLYCTGNAQEETKKEFDSGSSESYNNVIVSRGGDKVYLASTNQVYDTNLDSTMAGGNATSVDGAYRRVYYMSNNSIVSSYSTDYYLLFPNQSIIPQLRPIRHSYFMSADGYLIDYNVSTGEQVNYGLAGAWCYDEYHPVFVLQDTLFAAMLGYSYYYKWSIDKQNHTLGERQTFNATNFIVAYPIGTTADDKYVLFTNSEGSQLCIMRYENGEFHNVPTMNQMCGALSPYYNSTNGNYRFSFNEYTGNLHVITLDKFLVFHYENETFDLVFEKNLDFSTELFAPTIDDNFSVCAGGRKYNKQYFYMFPSQTEAGYTVENPVNQSFSNNVISGIVKVGGANGSDVQVIIPRFPTTTVTVTANANNAIIEQI